jgi:hypothetical protein
MDSTQWAIPQFLALERRAEEMAVMLAPKDSPREKWSDTIRGLFPSWPAAVELIDAVQALPGLGTWLPPRGIASAARPLIEWGFLLAITQRFDGIADVHRTIAQEIRQFDRPAQKTLSELSGAALCIALGATGGARISREKRHPHARLASSFRAQLSG